MRYLKNDSLVQKLTWALLGKCTSGLHHQRIAGVVQDALRGSGLFWNSHGTEYVTVLNMAGCKRARNAVIAKPMTRLVLASSPTDPTGHAQTSHMDRWLSKSHFSSECFAIIPSHLPNMSKRGNHCDSVSGIRDCRFGRVDLAVSDGLALASPRVSTIKLLTAMTKISG